MSRTMRRPLPLRLALGVALLAGAAGAQTPAPQGAVRVQLAPATITVGDLIDAELILVWDGESPREPPRFPAWQETWGSAEVRAAGEVLATTDEGGRRIYRQHVTLTAFAPGEVSLPPVMVAVPLAGGTVELPTPADTRFVVQSVLPAAPAEGAGTEAKEPELLPPAPPLALSRDLAFPLVAAALLGLAVLAAVLVVRRLRRAPRVEHGKVVLSPFDELRDRLGGLDTTDPETTHTAISTALRGYLGRRFAFPALESTTSEVQRRLRSRPVPTDTVRRSVQLLRDCDRAKFAREAVDPAQARERIRGALLAAKEVETALEPPSEADAARREVAA